MKELGKTEETLEAEERAEKIAYLGDAATTARANVQVMLFHSSHVGCEDFEIPQKTLKKLEHILKTTDFYESLKVFIPRNCKDGETIGAGAVVLDVVEVAKNGG